MTLLTLSFAVILYNSAVTEDSVAAKWGTRAAALAHVAGRTRQGKIAAAVLKGLNATASSFVRVIHLLFLEVTGFLFLCIGIIGGFASWREYQKVLAHTAPQRNLVIAIAFTAMFLWFGLSSFWRARRKSK